MGGDMAIGMRGVIGFVLCASCAGANAERRPDELARVPPDQLHAQDYSAAVRDYRRACDAGTAQACGYLGFMYDNGQGVEADVALAVDLSTRACTDGGAYGCAYLGYL